MTKKKEEKFKIIAENRRARREYEFIDNFEAGIMLTGTEVKALRYGKGNIAESYIAPKDGELYLINANIEPYAMGNRENHAPKRQRKLLLHYRELKNLIKNVEQKGLTIIPLRLYFNKKGLAKLAIALARGLKIHDKRKVEQKRDWQREKQRYIKNY